MALRNVKLSKLGWSAVAVAIAAAATTVAGPTPTWAALGFDGPPTQTIGMSAVVNDDDKGSTGDSRDGFLQWGSGVGTTPKDPSLFRDAQLVD